MWGLTSSGRGHDMAAKSTFRRVGGWATSRAPSGYVPVHDPAICILVSGPPGAGKTTFTRELGPRIGVPVVSMDDVKSGIALSMTPRDPAGVPDWRDGSVAGLGGPAGQKAFGATYEIATTLLRAGASLIIEKAWQRGRAEPDLSRLLEHGLGLQIHVTAPQEVAVSRGLGRPVRPGLVNMDAIAEMLASGQMTWESFDPLDLNIPLLTLDTHDTPDVDWQRVEDFVWQATAPA